MKAGTKKFDAVIESRKWKESIAEKTCGMTVEEVVAYFDRKTVHSRFEAALQRSEQDRAGGKN